ncbi:MAG: thermonuclease family protein, partial [Alcanivoracaceae bacterium]|nr:thermonuclease family protein [Alcanivoracaceae bacterium]
MVREGLATLNLYPPNLKYSKQLLLAQEMAEVEGLGIWGMSVYD